MTYIAVGIVSQEPNRVSQGVSTPVCESLISDVLSCFRVYEETITECLQGTRCVQVSSQGHAWKNKYIQNLRTQVKVKTLNFGDSNRCLPE